MNLSDIFDLYFKITDPEYVPHALLRVSLEIYEDK